jgi:hypothetical protein
MEAQEQATPVEVKVEDYQAPTVDSLFGAKQPAAEPAETLATESPTDVTSEAPAATLEATPAETQTTAAAEAPPVTTEPVPDPKSQGLLSGLQAERRKRQELQSENEQLRQQLAGNTTPEPVYDVPEADPRLQQFEKRWESRFLTMSEQAARKVHSDFQEKFDLLMAECAGSDTAAPNVALAKTIFEDSDDPGEAAYQAGVQLSMQKKYGNDPTKIVEKVRSEVEAELRPKLKAELEAEILGKVVKRSNVPTNISGAASASGGPAAAWQPTTVDKLYGGRRR